MVEYQNLWLLSLYGFIITFLAWCFAAWALSSLVRRSTGRGLRITLYLSFPFLLIITGIAVSQLVELVHFTFTNPNVLPRNYLFSLPFLLAPIALWFVWAMPEVWSLVRSVPQRGTVTDPKTRARFVSPRVSVPVQMGLSGAFFGHFVLLSEPSVLFGLGALTVWLAYVAWRWSRQITLNQSIINNGLEAIPRFLPRIARRFSILLGYAAGFALILFIAQARNRLPGSYSMGMDMHAAPGTPMVDMTQLTGPRDATPDRRFTLTAQKTTVKFEDGQTMEAWTYDGQAPGPELRVRRGELLEVTLKNKDVEKGVTIHWHGVIVPNAEDGVAGVTQDAVMPGETHVYRFRAADAGTYWYHSHQLSLDQIVGGLFGPLVVEPREGAPGAMVDVVIPVHSWRDSEGNFVFSKIGTTSHSRRIVDPNSQVRLRVINTDPFPRGMSLTGTPFKVAAIDGVALNEPGDLDHARLVLAGGGRYDLTFIMPDHPVLFSLQDNVPEPFLSTVLLSPDGRGDLKAEKTSSVFDPISYGKSRADAPLPTHFDQDHFFLIENGVGYIDGELGLRWLVNGRKIPNMPHVIVREGQWIRMKFFNRTFDDHPMHPHGHRMRVLSKNGVPSTGSPWWTDTVNVGPGETLEVAFKADNPGVWMDHCHNLIHAREGLIMHLLYENVMTPFKVGKETRNSPD